jgi:hypothetical protein
MPARTPAPAKAQFGFTRYFGSPRSASDGLDFNYRELAAQLIRLLDCWGADSLSRSAAHFKEDLSLIGRQLTVCIVLIDRWAKAFVQIEGRPGRIAYRVISELRAFDESGAAERTPQRRQKIVAECLRRELRNPN